MFLWHFPHARAHWALPSRLVLGSPDFPQGRLLTTLQLPRLLSPQLHYIIYLLCFLVFKYILFVAIANLQKTEIDQLFGTLKFDRMSFAVQI